jgi:hypothetical protein
MKRTSELQEALNRLKYFTKNDTYSIYKTPGGWYHVTDDQFGFLVSAPTSKTLTIAIDAYNDGFNAAILHLAALRPELYA